MKAIVVFRGHNMICGVFTTRESLVEYMKGVLGQWMDDMHNRVMVHIKVYDDHLSIQYRDGKAHFTFQETELDSLSPSFTDVTKDIIPLIIPLIEEYEWTIDDQRSVKP